MSTSFSSTLLFILLYSFPLYLSAQNSSSTSSDFINCVDAQYGTNDLLVNGSPYVAEHTKAKGFPYFLSKDWIQGTLFIKDNTFTNIAIKYNAVNDQLIIQRQLKNELMVEFIAAESLVDSFLLGRHLFVREAIAYQDEQLTGFVEKVYDSNIDFYQKHTKLFLSSTSSTKPFGAFSEGGNTLFALSEKGKQKIISLNSFVDIWGLDHKKAIKNYVKEHNIQPTKANKEQLLKLLKYCDEL